MIDRKEGDGLDAPSPTVSHGPEGHVVDSSRTHTSPSPRTICEGAPERKKAEYEAAARRAFPELSAGGDIHPHPMIEGTSKAVIGPYAATAGISVSTIRIRPSGQAHIYGTAWWETPDGDLKDEPITYPLDEDQARELNLIDGVTPGSLASYKAGDQCSRYPRRERLIADGLRILASRGHRGEVVIGAPWVYESEETRTIEEEG